MYTAFHSASVVSHGHRADPSLRTHPLVQCSAPHLNPVFLSQTSRALSLTVRLQESRWPLKAPFPQTYPVASRSLCKQATVM